MSRKTLGIVAAALLVLGRVTGAECADGAPKAECSTGARKVQHKGGKTKLYECHNQEWVKVTCFNGSSKSERGVYYICRSNEWKKG